MNITNQGSSRILSSPKIKIEVRSIQGINQGFSSHRFTTSGLTSHHDVLASNSRPNKVLPFELFHNQTFRFETIRVFNKTYNFFMTIRYLYLCWLSRHFSVLYNLTELGHWYFPPINTTTFAFPTFKCHTSSIRTSPRTSSDKRG